MAPSALVPPLWLVDHFDGFLHNGGAGLLHPVAGHGVRWVSAGPFVAPSRRLRTDTAFPPAHDPSKVFSSSAAVPSHLGLLPPHRLFHRHYTRVSCPDRCESNSPMTGLPPCIRVLDCDGMLDEANLGISSLVSPRAALNPRYAAGQLPAAQAVLGLRPSPWDAGLPLARGLLCSREVASSFLRDRSAGHPLAQPVQVVNPYRCEGLPCVSCPPCARGTMLRASCRL